MTKLNTDIEIDLDKVDEASSRAHAMDFPRTWLADKIEAVLKVIGEFISWIWVVLMLVIVVNVLMRYAFATNYIWVEEAQWHMYAVGYMIGIGFTIVHDGHVRVDVLAGSFSQRTRAVIEFLGLLLLVFPLIYFMILYAIPFVERSWIRNEASSAPGGLNHRWAIKSVILIAFTYMGFAAFARFTRVTAFLFGFPRPFNRSA